MPIHLNIIDAVSDPGKLGRANEDRAGYNNHAAFVLDGATGLGDQQFMDGYGSDAAWMAEFAMERLARDWQAGADIRELVRRISTDAREVFFATAGEQPRYAWPLAAFAALNAVDGGVTFTGLGDSGVYLLHDDGRSEFLAARPDAFEREQTAARAHLERIGGMGGASSIVNDPETLADLRKSREGQNTPGGRGWSFGLVPEVADHLTSQEITISGGATAIICSDGLGIWSPSTTPMMQAA